MGAFSAMYSGLFRPPSSVAEPVLTQPKVSLGPVWTTESAGISSAQIVSAVKRDLPSESTLARILGSFREAAASSAAERRVLPRGDEPGTEAGAGVPGLPWLALGGLALAGFIGYLAIA